MIRCLHLTTNTLPLKTIEIDDSKFILRLLIFNKYNIIISSLEIEKGSIDKTKSVASRQRFLFTALLRFLLFSLETLMYVVLFLMKQKKNQIMQPFAFRTANRNRYSS